MSIYQARFMRYLHDRGICETPTGRKVWAFVGDGEMDEPESLGAISLAGREKLDNLILGRQRQPAAARRTGARKRQDHSRARGRLQRRRLERHQGHLGKPLGSAARADKSGRLVQLMNECVDGDYQTFKSRDGKYVRDEFFGRYPETAALVADWSDDEIWALQRGGHDSIKVYAAYKAAFEHRGEPTVILAKTIKGYGMGEAGEAQNIAHQAKKMEIEAMRIFRDRFCASDLRRGARGRYDSVLQAGRRRAGDALSARAARRARERAAAARKRSAALTVPELSTFDAQLQGTGDRAHLDDDGVRARSQHDRARPGDRSRASCRSSPTNRARSAWKACSASSGSTRRSDSSTIRKTPSS